MPPQSNTADQTDDENDTTQTDEYLFVVNYDDQAERNRMANVLDQWEHGNITRPEGTIRIVNGTNQEQLLEQLINRVPADHVSCYQLDPVEPASETTTEQSFTVSFDESIENLDNMVNFIITNRRGRLKDPMSARYEINSQKGRVEVEYETADDNDDITLTITGNETPVEHMTEFFKRDFAILNEKDGQITTDDLPDRV
jgi:hypothetical protein